jgi:hypothetical protein
VLNTLACYDTEFITAAKKFYSRGPWTDKKSFVVQKPTEVCGLNKKATQAEKEQKK